MFSLHPWECTASHCKLHYNEPLCHASVSITTSKTEQSKKHPKPAFTLVGSPAKIKGVVLKSNSRSQHFKAHTAQAADLDSRHACTSGADVQESSERDHQNARSKKPRWQNLFPWPFFTINQYLPCLNCVSSYTEQWQSLSTSQLQAVAVVLKNPACRVTSLLNFKNF